MEFEAKIKKIEDSPNGRPQLYLRGDKGKMIIQIEPAFYRTGIGEGAPLVPHLIIAIDEDVSKMGNRTRTKYTIAEIPLKHIEDFLPVAKAFLAKDRKRIKKGDRY